MPTNLRRYLPKAVLFASVGLFLIALWLFFVMPDRRGATETPGTSTASQASSPSAQASLADVYERIRPSLVQVETRVQGGDSSVEEGHGTGIIIDERGSILTSLHIVQKPGRIFVVFPNGNRSEATISATQPEHDMAVLRTQQPPRDLVPAVLATAGSLRVGDEAIVVGNPFGLTGSLSVGVISGLGRTFQVPGSDARLSVLIQVDAAINPGNSGGPLLNREGDVVGVVTGLVNPTGQSVFIGIGFAVPIDVAVATAGAPPF